MRLVETGNCACSQFDVVYLLLMSVVSAVEAAFSYLHGYKGALDVH